MQFLPIICESFRALVLEIHSFDIHLSKHELYNAENMQLHKNGVADRNAFWNKHNYVLIQPILVDVHPISIPSYCETIRIRFITRIITSFMENPSPILKNIGSSTSSMYQPKLFNTWVTVKAQNGPEVKIWRQGTSIFIRRLL